MKPPSVRLVTVTVPVLAVGDITLTVHCPVAFVVQGLGVNRVPAPVQVYATVAPATGYVVVPSRRDAVITKSCRVPTGLFADAVIVTLKAAQDFVASGVVNSTASGALVALTSVKVVGVPPTVTVAEARPVTSMVPAPGVVDVTVTVHVPLAVSVGQVVVAASTTPTPLVQV